MAQVPDDQTGAAQSESSRIIALADRYAGNASRTLVTGNTYVNKAIIKGAMYEFMLEVLDGIEDV
jgi:hypothetical protein